MAMADRKPDWFVGTVSLSSGHPGGELIKRNEPPNIF